MRKIKKRGQITIFIIVGIVIMIIFGLIYYIRNYVIKEKIAFSTKKTTKLTLDITPIRRHTETCLEKVSEEGVWLVGVHGGYIDPDGNPFYGEGGNVISSSTTYQGDKVPYYLDGNSYTYPPLNQIEEKLSKYIIVEFEKCLNLTVFENMGFEITQPNVNYKTTGYYDSDLVDSKVSINKEDVIVQIRYPLIIRKKGTVTELSDFRVSLPVRLKTIYNSVTDLISMINSQPYDITPDCGMYDTNSLTNIYFKNDEIIQFMDFETYEHKYLKTYRFQFAIKNVDFSGECVG